MNGASAMVVVCQLLLLITIQQTVRYDKVTLLDGRVITGQIEHEDDEYLMIRVVRSAGRINYVKRLAKRHIDKREFVDLPERAASSAATESSPAATEPTESPSGRIIDDKPAQLRSVFEAWNIRNIRHAATRLLRLINQCSTKELAELDELCRGEVHASLADFTARLNMEYAVARAEQGFFKLYFLTPFSLERTHSLLNEAMLEGRSVGIVCQGHAPSGPACQRVDSIADWIDRPTKYDGGGMHAVEFSKQITRTMGMARESVRLSQALHREKKEIVQLNTQREKLRQLLEVVNDRKFREETPR